MARLVSKLTVIADGADEAVSLALHDTANFILNLIRILCPVDTGWLRDSHQKESLALTHIIIGTMVNYSVFVNFGTSRNRSNPYFTTAFHQAESVFKQNFVKRLKDLG